MASSLYILALMATLVIFANAQKSQYCNLRSCEGKGRHSLCEYNPKVPSPNCGTVYSSGLTKSQQDDILKAHNDYRDQVAKGLEKRGNPGPQPAATNLKPLQWDPELAEIAQAWVNQCKESHDKCRDTEKWSVGQNLGTGYNSDLSGINFLEPVTGWYNEVENINPSRHITHFYFSGWEEFKKIGHYIQLVWAETTHVGCGFIVYSPDNKYHYILVCNYGPGGNIKEFPVYNEQ